MSQLIKTVYEKLMFAGTLAAAVLSLLWFGSQQRGLRVLQGGAATSVVSGPAHVATEWRRPEAAVVEWPEPPPQSKGKDWLYEVFTPPVIHHDALVGAYSVTSLHPIAGPEGEAAGLELLAVRLQSFRLQLHGYFGEPGDYLAAFVSPQTPETLLARPGHRFEQLGLTFKSIAVRKVMVEGGEFGPVHEVAAFAVLQEEATGAEVVLDSRTRKLTATPLAMLKVPGPVGQLRELIEGDTFAVAGVAFRVARIQLEPPEVVVTRATPGLPGSERLVLRPAAQVAVRNFGPPPQAPTDVAHHEEAFPSP